MSICEDPKYTCGDKKEAIVNGADVYTCTVMYDRNISLTVGSLTVPLQQRSRQCDYSRVLSFSKTNFIWVKVNVSGEIFYLPCFTADYSSSSSFSDEYTTLDAQLEYLDLRNNTAVVKTITNSYKITDADSVAETDTISVFTGYDSQPYNSYVFDGFPIAENITHTLHIGETKSILGSEDVNRGYPYLALLMPTFPWSPWGISINTEWAQEIDWYRQDLRKTAELDGDEWLFWPHWSQALGQMAQSFDERNRQLIYELDHLTPRAPITSSDGSPYEVKMSSLFRGSVAFDANKNFFYSIAVPTSEYAVDPDYTLSQKLVINDQQETIPTDAESDAWYPIIPL